MKKVFILGLFALTLLLPNYASAEFSQDKWQYYKDVANGAVFDNENVSVALDNELITQVQDNLRDVRLINQEDKEIPYELTEGVFRNKAVLADVYKLYIDGESVNKEQYNTSRINDEDKKSHLFIPSADIYRTVSVVYDLKEETVTDRVVSFNYNSDASWQAISVEGSNNFSDWKVIRSRIEDAHQTWRWYGFPRDLSYQYYKITFEVKGDFILNELMLNTLNEGGIQFKAYEGDSYKLYYGSFESSIPEYSDINYWEDTAFTNVQLGDQKKNPNFEQDFDKDGVVYRDDNCPYLDNPNQEDLNNDGRGDLCENNFSRVNIDKEDNSGDQLEADNPAGSTVENDNSKTDPLNVIEQLTGQKNELIDNVQTNVNDRDNDGISNVFDNCPNTYNPDQRDEDLDGKGDICDTNENQRKYMQVIVAMLIFVCLVIIFSIVKIALNSVDSSEVPEKSQDSVATKKSASRIRKKRNPKSTSK